MHDTPLVINRPKMFVHFNTGLIERMSFWIEKILPVPLSPGTGLTYREIKQ